MGRQSPEPLVRRLTHRVESSHHNSQTSGEPTPPTPTNTAPDLAGTSTTSQPTVRPPDSRAVEALKQLFCGGMAGSVAKTVTAPLSRLTILYQVHPMVTTKETRPKFAMSIRGGLEKIIQRGGMLSLWKGNGTSVLHRFPFSAINFYCYEGMLDILNGPSRLSDEDEDDMNNPREVSTFSRLVAGAVAGSTACVACYPLDLVRTRLTTQLDGQEHYKGITDAFVKIVRSEGVLGLYSGIAPTLMVAVPSFSISYMVYGSLKEYALEDELFYNLRKVDTVTGEEKLGFQLTLMCGAASGILSTLVTFPFDTVRRRMQIQSLHFALHEQISGVQIMRRLFKTDGLKGFYRGITPEVLKVIPMVSTMFTVYEMLKDKLNVK